MKTGAPSLMRPRRESTDTPPGAAILFQFKEVREHPAGGAAGFMRVPSVAASSRIRIESNLTTETSAESLQSEPCVRLPKPGLGATDWDGDAVIPRR